MGYSPELRVVNKLIKSGMTNQQVFDRLKLSIEFKKWIDDDLKYLICIQRGRVDGTLHVGAF